MPATIRPCSGPGIFMCCFANLAHVDWRRRGGSFAEASVYGRNAWNKRTKEQPRTEIEGKIVSLTSPHLFIAPRGGFLPRESAQTRAESGDRIRWGRLFE